MDIKEWFPQNGEHFFLKVRFTEEGFTDKNVGELMGKMIGPNSTELSPGLVVDAFYKPGSNIEDLKKEIVSTLVNNLDTIIKEEFSKIERT